MCKEATPSQVERGEESEKVRECSDWAEKEFVRSQLPDKRLTKRLLNISRDFFAQSGATIPQACRSRSKTKRAYRFLTTNG